MLRDLDGLSEEALVRWIEDSLASGRHRLGQGYQGETLLYRDEGRRLVIKAASGRGLRRWLSLHMLRREARVYRQLDGFAGAPRCHGLAANRYLVLEYIDGQPARYAEIADREEFFTELLALLEGLHARGIAHSDLQKKDNLYITRDGRPCLLDYGVAVIRKPGFAPFNHLHYRIAVRLDFNQWVKLKYQGRLDQIAERDRRYYRRTALERVARRLKMVLRRIRPRR